MGFQIEPVSEYAAKAKDSADRLGLGFKVYSFSAIIGSVPQEGDIIARCCEVTGTEYDEQLKFALASDITLDPESYAHPGIGVVRYGDMLKFGKLADVLLAAEIYRKPEFKRGDFSARKADPRAIGIDPGYLGINQMARYRVTVIGHDQRDVHSTAPITYVFDSPIRELPRICFPTGEGKADDLVVVSADTAMGDQLDRFLDGFIGADAFLFGDISKPGRPG
jgi:hypothetical protein